MTTFMIIGFCLVLLALFLYFLKKPVRHEITSIEALHKHFEDFLLQFDVGSILFVTHKKMKYFVQFVLESRNGDSFVLKYGFPDAPWSRDFFPNVQKSMEDNHVKFELKRTGDFKVSRFLEVRTSDLNEAVTLAQMTVEALDLSIHDSYFVHYDASFREDYVNGLKSEYMELRRQQNL